ncbi:MAG: peptidoglycan D,D-transpeptidase FtsI family protein [Candidatus Dormibacteria bacterium]
MSRDRGRSRRRDFAATAGPVRVSPRRRPRHTHSQGWADGATTVTSRVRSRVGILLALTVLASGGLVTRLVYWQILQHSSLTAMAMAQYEKVVTLPAQRGAILDRNGLPLALDTPVFSVFALPDQVDPSQRAELADKLAGPLQMDREVLLQRIADPRHKFVYLKRRVPAEVATELQQDKFAGIGLVPETERSYLDGGVPGTTLASDLLGFVNYDGQGQYGVEGYYQKQLSGRDGQMSTFRDLADREIALGSTSRVDAVDGDQLTLTIDSSIQYVVERALADGVQKVGGEGGTAIVMDPATGGIVAWADYPAYNANQFTTQDPAAFTDQGVSGTYEPGSVMKVVSLSGALADGAITPDGRIQENGVISVGGFQIHNWDMKAHGNVTWTQVLEQSLNVGAVIAEQREGGANFYRNLVSFGFGAPTGIDLAGEANVALPALADLKDSQLATMSFGQGISVTPIQMLAAVNAVANGGVWIQPHVLMTRTTASGDSVDFTPVQRPVLSPDIENEMRQMMISVVEKGSGGLARVPGFTGQIAGKTGTASVAENGRYGDQVIGSFAGFLPADQPRFTMMVVVRKPKILFEGAYVAAPVWREIASQIVVQWRIAPK